MQEETGMDTNSHGRRAFLMKITAIGAALSAGRAYSAAGEAGSNVKTAYNPAAKFEIKVREVEFRRNAAGRQLMARIYQLQGAGPFPTVLDLHGGAWNNKNRKAEEPMDRAIA